MNDKELADAVVALGVGEYSLGHPVDPNGYTIGRQVMTHERFVTDWRVAGTLMEKVTHAKIFLAMNDKDWKVSAGIDGRTEGGRNESLPRAIIEACVAALSDRS
jgi:hypothetical protein